MAKIILTFIDSKRKITSSSSYIKATLKLKLHVEDDFTFLWYMRFLTFVRFKSITDQLCTVDCVGFISKFVEFD